MQLSYYKQCRFCAKFRITYSTQATLFHLFAYCRCSRCCDVHII